jgi:hypothetical protein
MPEQSVRAWLFNRLANKKNKVMLVGAGGICYNQVWLFFWAVSLRREGMWDFSDCISALSKKVLIPPFFLGRSYQRQRGGTFLEGIPRSMMKQRERTVIPYGISAN